MKLQDLHENLTSADIHDITQKNLVMVSTGGKIYVISDVPAISDDKFNELRDLSFDYESARYAVRRVDPDNTDWQRWEEAYRRTSRGQFGKVEVVKWKDYVAVTQWTGRDEDDDDFSE